MVDAKHQTHDLQALVSLDPSFDRSLKFRSCLSTLQSERRQLFCMQKDPKIEKKFVSREENPPRVEKNYVFLWFMPIAEMHCV